VTDPAASPGPSVADTLDKIEEICGQRLTPTARLVIAAYLQAMISSAVMACMAGIERGIVPPKTK
jgi:hypothetical protein